MSRTQPRTQTPDDYAHLLSSAAPSGELPILIGGQAVNFWAMQFLEKEPDLKQFSPFVSGDCDVLASVNWLRDAADKHGLPYKMFKAGQASPAVGWISLPSGDKPEIELQVLRDVFGLTREEVSDATFDVMLEEGGTVRVLSPTKLLQAKIANLYSLPQQDRHDLAHVQILIHCVRASLKQQIAQIEKGQTTPRKCINLFERVVRLITSDQAKAVAGKFGIDLKQAIPTKEISDRKETPFRNFTQKRLPKIL